VQLFGYLGCLYPTPETFTTAIELRRQRKMSLGDALIAATALEHRLILATCNVKDFEWITGLKIVNPIREMF
jgi:toxin FitB